MKRPLTYLVISLLGFLLEVAGTFYDSSWHRAHPGPIESAGTMAGLHIGIYGGVLLVLLAAGAGAMRLREKSLMLIAMAAFIQTVGISWDVYAHSGGPGMLFAHWTTSVGLVLVIVSLAFGGWVYLAPREAEGRPR